MKYLSKYKLFESLEETKKELEEICYDLTDIGFRFHIYSKSNINSNNILEVTGPVRKNKKPSETALRFFFFDEIEEVLYRIKDLLGERILQLSFAINNTYVKYDIDKLMKEEIDGDKLGLIGSFGIIFSNE